jgi:ATP citrate (pro-S)-lyase
MPLIKLSEYTAKKIYSSDWDIRKITRNDIGKDHIRENSTIDEKFVIKVDEFVKRRGKKGLIRMNITKNKEIDNFIEENKDYSNFILEKQIEIISEKYFCILIKKGKKQYIFSHQGGINCDPNISGILSDSIEGLDIKIPEIFHVLEKLDKMFNDIDAYYLEINPLVNDSFENWIPVDFAVKVDSYGLPFWNKKYIQYFDEKNNETGNDPTEKKIRKLDESSGSSFKFKKLNPNGNILTLIAGGGASVLFTDAIVNCGMIDKLYNYGEYSGNPSFDEIYKYCLIIFEDWLNNNSNDKILIIGGGISNFTDVAQTFKGIIKAIEEFQILFVYNKIKVFIRRGGVNETIGLEFIRLKLEEMNIPVVVKGTEYPITQIILDIFPNTTNFYDNINDYLKIYNDDITIYNNKVYFDENNFDNYCNEKKDDDIEKPDDIDLWNDKIIFVGNHNIIIQRIIDYDFYLGKNEPDILCIYDEFTDSKIQSFFWGSKQINLEITNNVSKIINMLGNNTATIYNYASIRSYESVINKLIKIKNAKTYYIIAEGIPMSRTIKMRDFLKKNGKSLLGPSSVGAIKAGLNGKRIGNVGGLIENIKKVNLAQYGNVAVITKSGGLLNEMIHFCYNLGLTIGEAVSIGGDSYCGIRFIDLLKYYESVDNINLIIMIGETGGTAEIDAAKWWNKYGKKKVVGWCSGTSEKSFGEKIEFGHAGAFASSDEEEAFYKNIKMHEYGIVVPESFEQLGNVLDNLKNQFAIKKIECGRNVPMEIDVAIKNGVVRINPNIITKMTDERTDLKYRGELIEEIVGRKFSIGYSIANLWLNCKIDKWAAEFIEKILVIMADHGPAVSGAHNTIVTARAGKGLVESLVSGLLTIGPKFGGAVAEAAKDFYEAWKSNETADEFVARKKREGKLIMGIGHRIKSKYNPDKRVEVIQRIVDARFPKKKIFTYAKKVEKETLEKKANLILNVDGAIGAALADILIYYGRESFICDGDILNGFFVLARTIGFIGHYNEQRKNGLFRANNWDVDYL